MSGRRIAGPVGCLGDRVEVLNTRLKLPFWEPATVIDDPVFSAQGWMYRVRLVRKAIAPTPQRWREYRPRRTFIYRTVTSKHIRKASTLPVAQAGRS
jgi:hypothetical protein